MHACMHILKGSLAKAMLVEKFSGDFIPWDVIEVACMHC
jgi:hypothetical protein